MLGGVEREGEDPATMTEGLECKGPLAVLLCGSPKTGWNLK